MKLTKDRLKEIIKEELEEIMAPTEMPAVQQPEQTNAPAKHKAELSIKLLRNYFQKQLPGVAGESYIKDIQYIEDFINSVK